MAPEIALSTRYNKPFKHHLHLCTTLDHTVVQHFP